MTVRETELRAALDRALDQLRAAEATNNALRLQLIRTESGYKPAYYTIEELSGVLRVSQDQLRREIRLGRLNAVKVGSAIRVSAKDFEDYQLQRMNAASKIDMVNA